MKIDEDKIVNNKPIKKGFKVDKTIIIGIAVIAAFILLILYIFNLDDTDTKAKIQEPKKELHQEQQKPINQFDTSKIKQIQETQAVQEQNQTQAVNESPVNLDNQVIESLRKTIKEQELQIKTLKAENQILKTAFPKKDVSAQAEPEQNTKDDMKKTLLNLKRDITLKNNFFSFMNKNYYIGDKLNGYKIKDITKNDIRFCNSDWCYTLRF